MLAVSEQFQRQGRAVYHLPPPTLVRTAGDPVAPEVHRLLESDALIIRLVAWRRLAGQYDLEDEPGGLVGAEREFRHGSSFLELHRHRGAEAQHQLAST